MAVFNEYAQQCPHKHFKGKVVDRGFLTREQHLDLLCTPRGYRWEVEYRVTSKPKVKNVCDQSRSKLAHPKAYVYNILAELWSLVTPEMIARMKTILMEEFAITEDEAVDFMCKKVQETMYFASPQAQEQLQLDIQDFKNEKPPIQPNLIQPDLEKSIHTCEPLPGVKPKYIKMFSNVVSKKLAEILTTSMHSKRTKKHKVMADCILERLCKITGDYCTMDSPKTILQRGQTFLADKFALWILQNIEDEEAQKGRRRALEDVALKKKINAKLKEKQQREKERIELAQKLKKQKKQVKKEESEKSEQKENQKKQQERVERHVEWLKQDEANRKKEQRKKKELAGKKKKEQEEKVKKEAKMKEYMANENASRKKRKK